ncbi:MAG: hypothetical protein ACYTAO_16360, partial [Planctomycetota bacterium]
MRKNQAIFIAAVLVLSGHALAREYHEKGYQYLSPIPEAEYVSQSKIAADERTVIFDVSSSFSKNEIVTVTLTPMTNRRVREVIEPFQYCFYISRSADSLSAQTAADAPVHVLSYTSSRANAATLTEDAASTAVAAGPMVMQNGVSVPS